MARSTKCYCILSDFFLEASNRNFSTLVVGVPSITIPIIMSLISALTLSALLVRVVSLTILPPLQTTAAGLLPSPVALKHLEINTPFPVNVSTGSSNVLKIQCDGNSYGRNLNVASCKKIFNFIDKKLPERVFADRRTGIYADILLPWRIYDSMSMFVRLSQKAAYSAVRDIGGIVQKLIQCR